jgi:hypothetical protein
MYSLICEENGFLKEKKTAKGIKKSVIKQHTKRDHYKEGTEGVEGGLAGESSCF